MNLQDIKNNRLKDLPKEGFHVYKFENLLNGKIYIGLTSNLNNRIREHIKCSSGKFPIHCYIHKALKKYGLSNFNLYWKKYDNEKEVIQAEIYYISKYQSNQSSKGYNLTTGGERFKMNEDVIDRIKLGQKRKAVSVYSLEGKYIETYDSIMDCSRALNISDSDIIRCCKNSKSRNNLMFSYVKQETISPYTHNLGIWAKENLKGKVAHNAKKCKLINKNTDEIIEANSLKELSVKSGLHNTTLYNILNNQNHKKYKIEYDTN